MTFTFSRVSKALLIIVFIVAGFFLAQSFRSSLVADGPSELFAKHASLDALAAEEAAKPRFIGEIGGIFIAPEGTKIPDEYVTFEDLCGDLFTKSVEWGRAGILNFDVKMPPEYVLEEEDDLLTGVVACGETVTGVNRFYRGPTWQNGVQSQVTISRTLGAPFFQDISVAEERPKLMTIEGREVIVIQPLTKDGYEQHGYAWFPESFGVTSLHTVDLPRKDFMSLVKTIARDTQ